MTWPVPANAGDWLRNAEKRLRLLERKAAGSGGGGGGAAPTTLAVEDTATLDLTLTGDPVGGYLLKGDVAQIPGARNLVPQSGGTYARPSVTTPCLFLGEVDARPFMLDKDAWILTEDLFATGGTDVFSVVGQVSGGGSASWSPPAGVQIGDFAIALYTAGGAAAFTPGPGWTLLTDDAYVGFWGTRMIAWTKVVSSLAADSIVTSETAHDSWIVTYLRGVGSVNPASRTETNMNAATNGPTPATTAPHTLGLLVAANGGHGANVVWPAGWTNAITKYQSFFLASMAFAPPVAAGNTTLGNAASINVVTYTLSPAATLFPQGVYVMDSGVLEPLGTTTVIVTDSTTLDLTLTGTGAPATPYSIKGDVLRLPTGAVAVTDTATVDMTLTGGGTVADPLTVKADVIKIPAGAITVTDTATVDLTLTGAGTVASPLNLQAAVIGGAGTVVPPGAMIMWASDAIPTGWLLCGGQAVSRTTYAALFAQIGTQFGVGDNSTTFNVPNMLDRVPVGKGGQTAFNVMGKQGGEMAHQITIPEMPSHAHPPLLGRFNMEYNVSGTGTGSAGWGAGTDMNTSDSTGYSGGVTPMPVLQPYTTLNFLIKW